ncbi:MAG: hypothetical protein ACI3ZD_13815 [Prevotella sp.]
MNYIVCTTIKAKEYGFQMYGRISNGKDVFLNEKEVINSQTLNGTLEERAETLEGKVLTETEALKLKNIDESWKNLAHKAAYQSEG